MTNPIDFTQNYFILNGDLKQVKDFDAKNLTCRKVIYEVIKVVKGTPLFFNEHINRLMRSCSLSDLHLPDLDLLTRSIIKLLDSNPVELQNIRISLCYGQEPKPNFLCYFIDSVYPTPVDYKNGVKVDILKQTRKLPNVKAENPVLRNAADKVIKNQNVFETLLVDDEGFVTECSRSNFFAVYGNEIVTPPASDVLEGITRMKVIELADENGIGYAERKIMLSELHSFESAFITGTSRGVLPLSTIGEQQFNVNNKLVVKLMFLYNRLVDENIINWRKSLESK